MGSLISPRNLLGRKERKNVSLALTAKTFQVAVTLLLVCALLVWISTAINWAFVKDLDFSVIYKFRAALLEGVWVTLYITFFSLLLGLTLGLGLACLSYVPSTPLRWIIRLYLELARDTPLVVALFWIHFALPSVTGISTTAFQSGFIAMALQSSAYLADVARAGIQAVPRGQWEASKALGLSGTWTWVEIVLPQAFKIMVPPLANVALGYFKASSVLALLSVGELMSVAVRISNYTFKPIEVLTFVGAIYLVLSYILSWLTYRLEHLMKTGA